MALTDEERARFTEILTMLGSGHMMTKEERKEASELLAKLFQKEEKHKE